MEKNQSQELISAELEPAQKADNSISAHETETSQNIEGQSQAPSKLILGKFKTTEDLSKAYTELQKLQGNQSAELGKLREHSAGLNLINQAWKREQELIGEEKDIKNVVQKYNTYFQDPSFREIYKNAYLALGANLDADKFINLLEGYVSSRIFAYDREKSALAETQSATDKIRFDKNDANTKASNHATKRVEEMNPKEYEEFLRALI